MKPLSQSGSAQSKFALCAGLFLVLLYCILATGADAITRVVSQGFAAPQLYFMSGGLVALFSLVASRIQNGKGNLRSKRPRSLALRSALFIASCLCYFHAFKALPFAEVFAFIALVPIFAGLLSGPILGEPVRWQSWCALLAGLGGMLLLYPAGISELSFAHLSAALGAFSGASAMILARHISRDDKNALIQVFYPNLAMCAVMGMALPFFYREMQVADIALILGYAALLFLARWVLVLCLARMKAYVVTLLMNLQFVVMIGVGMAMFGEMPTLNLLAGAGMIILAGSYLFLELILPSKRDAPALEEVQLSVDVLPKTAAITSKNLSRSHMSSSRSDFQ